MTKEFSTEHWVEFFRFGVYDQVVKTINDYQRAVEQLEEESAGDEAKTT